MKPENRKRSSSGISSSQYRICPVCPEGTGRGQVCQPQACQDRVAVHPCCILRIGATKGQNHIRHTRMRRHTTRRQEQAHSLEDTLERRRRQTQVGKHAALANSMCGFHRYGSLHKAGLLLEATTPQTLGGGRSGWNNHCGYDRQASHGVDDCPAATGLPHNS